jgi:hypothetical protein
MSNNNMSVGAIQTKSVRFGHPTLSVSERDPDPHGIFRRYRLPITPRAPTAVQEHLKGAIAAVTIGCGPLLLGSQANVAAADAIPKLAVDQTCEGAAREPIAIDRDKEACMSDEKEAQELVTTTWSQYAADDKTQCVGMVTKGGPPSYVELLSCLEMMGRVRTLRKLDDRPVDNDKFEARSIPPFDLAQSSLTGRNGKRAHVKHKRTLQQARG